VPETGATVVVGGAAPANKHARVWQPVAEVPGIVRIGNNANGGLLELQQGGTLRLSTLQMATGPVQARGYLAVTGGSLKVDYTGSMAASNPGAFARIRVSAGRLDWGYSLVVSMPGSEAELVVSGTGPEAVFGEGITLAEGARLVFELDASGVTPLEASGYFNNHDGARLTVERGDFAWGEDAEVLLVGAATVL